MDPNCAICGNARSNKLHRAREMMLGLRTTFEYMECANCGCLQLLTRPENLAEYYPATYHSFAEPKRPVNFLGRAKQTIRRSRNRALLGNAGFVGQALTYFFEFPKLRSLAFLRTAPETRILDVGCGSGELLLELADLGFRNLLGIDPFISSDIRYASLTVRKGTLSDLAGTTWDVIMFHHSFEHIPEQRETLRQARQLLRPGGQCLIRIPVVSTPWFTYGVDWVELDAPRHFFLHTERGMGLLAESVGFELATIRYDSGEFQFWGSELYRRGHHLCELKQRPLHNFFSRQQLRKFRRQARKLNREGKGGRAAFYLQRTTPCNQAEPKEPASPSHGR